MKRYVLLALLAALLVGLCATTATASIGITFDGKPDTLEDKSRAMAVSSTDDYLNEGDIIFGLVRIDNNITPGQQVQISDNLAEIIVAFAAKITAMTTVTADKKYVEYTLGVAPGFLAGQLTAHPGIGNNDMFAVLVMPEPAPDPTFYDSTQAYQILNNTHPSISSSFTLFASGTLGDDDYFKARLWDRDTDPGIKLAKNASGDITGIPEYAGLPITAQVGSELVGATYSFLPPGIVVASKVPLVRYDQTISWHDIALDARLFPASFGGEVDDGWLFTDSSIMETNLVPEPASVVCWLCLGGLALAGYAARRRKPVA